MGKKLSNIKEILSNIDYDYDNADWKKLERDLQKQNRYSRFSKLGYTSLATVVVLAIVAIYFSLSKAENNLTQESAEPEIISIIQLNDSLNDIADIMQDDIITEVEVVAKEKIIISENKDVFSNTENKNTKLTIKEQEPESPIISEEAKKVIQNISFDIKIVNNCTPAKVLFSALNVPSGYEIKWDTGDEEILSGDKVEYIYKKGNDYLPKAYIFHNNVELKNHNIRQISISQSNSAKINIEKENDNTFNLIGNTDTNSKVNYTWHVQNKSFHGQSIEYSFAKNGKYKIFLTVSNSSGCITTAVEEVEIE